MDRREFLKKSLWGIGTIPFLKEVIPNLIKEEAPPPAEKPVTEFISRCVEYEDPISSSCVPGPGIFPVDPGPQLLIGTTYFDIDSVRISPVYNETYWTTGGVVKLRGPKYYTVSAEVLGSFALANTLGEAGRGDNIRAQIRTEESHHDLVFPYGFDTTLFFQDSYGFDTTLFFQNSPGLVRAQIYGIAHLEEH